MYSGRGRRGGRGAHHYYRGRPPFGGRGHDSLGGRSQRLAGRGGRMSWVKSRDGVSSEAVKLSGAEDPKNSASSSPLDATASSNQTVETATQQKQPPPPTASGSGPILRGPRNHGQRWGGHGRSGRGGFQSRGSAGMNFQQKKMNTWRRGGSVQTDVERPKQEEDEGIQEGKSDQFGDATEAGEAQIQNREENRAHMQTIGHANQVAGANADNSTEVQNPGKIQQPIVESESQFADASDDDEPGVALPSQNNKEKNAIQASNPEMNKIARESRETTELKLGSTKTVPAKSISSAAQLREQNETETALQEDMGATEHNEAQKPRSPGKQQQQQRKMIHKGNNKLVLSAPASYRGGKQKTVTSPARYQYESHHGGRGGRRKRSPSSVPTVKRIKISAPEKEPASGTIKGGEEGETTASAESEQGKKNPDVSATSETLTDFAYRSRFHSFGSGRGRGRGRGSNMGLVRVNPDETKTPICPTFLRGVRCENELCQKRHDVPIESARPVCFFFQRHGQCLKGADCPFRHVKMNPLAMLCPSFNLLGYCDDEKCVMKHVAANKSARNDRGSKSKVIPERSREGK